jgi:hypothetical protein
MYDLKNFNSVGHRSCNTQHIGFLGNVLNSLDLGGNPKEEGDNNLVKNLIRIKNIYHKKTHRFRQ